VAKKESMRGITHLSSKSTEELKGKLSHEKFTEQLRKDEKTGFELIKKFVHDYPKTEYPTVDDDLIETKNRISNS